MKYLVFFSFFIVIFGKSILDTTTFSHAHAQAPLTHEETVIFQRNVSLPSAITHWWFACYPQFVVIPAILRFYVDFEKTASIVLPVDESIGVSFDDDQANVPWANSMIGKGAKGGGTWSDIRIPFYRSIVVTLQQPEDNPEGEFWFIIRGMEGISVNIGEFELPDTTKLVVYTTELALKPLEKMPIVNVQKRGALFFMTLQITSGNLNCLEGCFRCFVDGGAQMLMSSGTEDYFDSAYYFDTGLYSQANSGLTHLNSDNGPLNTTVSLYRFHDQEPITWKKSFLMQWRNGDTNSKDGLKCVDDNGSPAGDPQPSIAKSIAWVYHY